MSDERKKYRSLLLDQQTSKDNFRSEVIDVTVADQTLEVEVKALPTNEFKNGYIPDDLIDEVGEEGAMKITLATKCAYIPGTDDRVWDPPVSENNTGDVMQLAEGPMNANGPVERINAAVNYVHGFRATPPPGIVDPRMQEMSEAADHLVAIAEAADEEGEELHAGEVKSIAESIASRLRYIDHGSTSGK